MHTSSTDSPGANASARAAAILVSDVHLQEGMPHTAAAFFDFLACHAPRSDKLFLLGDLFEYWAGDDDLPSLFHRQVADAIHAVKQSGTDIFWIAGNRDFLVGAGFAQATGATILPDPSFVEIAGLSLVLSHGDAWCTDDLPYMEFRRKVRSPEWQAQFLAMPLTQRKAIIEGMRQGSRDAQRGKSYEIMDVNKDAIAGLFGSCDAQVMIHGHTHRPAMHEYAEDGGARLRYVLPDWDCDGAAKRGGWISILPDGSIERVFL